MVQKAMVVAGKDGSTAQTWALPVLGMFAMLALAAGIGSAVCRRRRSTRQVQVYQNVLLPDIEEIESEFE